MEAPLLTTVTYAEAKGYAKANAEQELMIVSLIPERQTLARKLMRHLAMALAVMLLVCGVLCAGWACLLLAELIY